MEAQATATPASPKRTRTSSQKARWSVRKGKRVEKETLEKMRELGLDARLTQHSGATADKSEKGDVLLKTAIGQLRGEVKARGSKEGFIKVLRWLGKNDFLIIKPDRCEPIVVLPEKTFRKIAEILSENR